MTLKSLSSGPRMLVTHSIPPSLQTRSIITVARQLKTGRSPSSLWPSQRWAPPTPTPTRSLLLTLRAYSIPSASSTDSPAPNTPKQPSYELTFTCNPCGSRSAHTISKQGYHYGSILITCPTCRNRHVISDHLHIFGQREGNLEEMLKAKGQLVKRGTLGEDGDLEFWDDGTTTVRSERQGEGQGQDPKAPMRKESRTEKEGETEVAGSTFVKT